MIEKYSSTTARYSRSNRTYAFIMPAGGPIVDEFFSTVPVLNCTDVCDFHARFRPFTVIWPRLVYLYKNISAITLLILKHCQKTCMNVESVAKFALQ